MSEHEQRFDFLTDQPAPAVHALLKEFGLCMDEAFRGELTRLLDLPGHRRAYFRKRGLTIDGLAEMLWDRRITGRRLSTVEVLEVLELVMVNEPTRKSRRRRASEAVGDIERLARKATDNRQRKFQCERCGQIARGTRKSDLICGGCIRAALSRVVVDLKGVMSERLAADIVRVIEAGLTAMQRIDPLPEEILEAAGAA